jgi:hypothetical protein
VGGEYIHVGARDRCLASMMRREALGRIKAKAESSFLLEKNGRQ